MGKREENKRRTRRALLDAARSLAVETGVFPGMDEVAARAGVSRATFFNYFRGKDEFVTELLAERLESLADRVDQQLALETSTGERIATLFTAFVRERGAQSNFFFHLVTEMEKFSDDPGFVAERHRLFEAELQRLIEGGLKRGDVRDDISPALLAELIRAAYLATVQGYRGDDAEDLIVRFEEAARFVASAISR